MPKSSGKRSGRGKSQPRDNAGRFAPLGGPTHAQSQRKPKKQVVRSDATGLKAKMTDKDRAERRKFLRERAKKRQQRNAAHNQSGSARTSVERLRTTNQVRDSSGRRIDSFKDKGDARDAQRMYDENPRAIPASKYKGMKPKERSGYKPVYGLSGRVVGYEPGSTPTAKRPSVRKEETHTPPKAVRAEAARALEWMKDGQAGGGFTSVGRRRASQLANGQPVSVSTMKRMASYLARHEVDKKGKGWSPGEPGYPSAGRVAWAAWGGDPARSWVGSILDRVEKGQKAGPGKTAEKPHGPSILEPRIYEALRRKGVSKEKAARISNAMHRRKKRGKRKP